jgi:hypothetical protein
MTFHLIEMLLMLDHSILDHSRVQYQSLFSQRFRLIQLSALFSSVSVSQSIRVKINKIYD